ncbi:hypothetical protein [Xenorhabdus innexi]|uniref:Peptidase C58 YopT-type domain-containing protein n=1 Tax=Xenorhabdus innexi TaxID=290109 RepID=A0A1N6MT40_9GAMM|nr:hypothetical protein [Xenorhabdus innexi]PHM30161.1 hypothetical protein Xinn_03487 [Xenorhabdus innexi]SIP71909.1 hypothetical protein XIS1_1290006 [Xenorhabdus innexi]
MYKTFSFRQSNLWYGDEFYSSDGSRVGRCQGIIFYILANLYESEGDNITPDKAFELTEMYVKMFNLTKNRITGMPTIIENISKLGSKISQLQKNYGHLKPIGFTLRNFSEKGYGIIYMKAFSRAENIPSTVHAGGIFFHQRNEMKNYMKDHQELKPNHVGLLVWDNSKLFIFDPNTGGQLVDKKYFTAQGIEGRLNLMYITNNRPTRVRIILIVKPDFFNEKNSYFSDALR